MLQTRILIFTVSLAYLPYAWASTCSRAVSRSEKYHVHCGTWNWRRCSRYRTVYSRENYCCPGWHGGGCSTPICNRRCLNGGTCVGPEKCKCDVYHSGSQCQTEVAYCGRQPCQNGGTCVGPEKCLCDLFHYGHSCQFKKSCNNKTLELLFLLDSSGNIGHTNFEILKTFVKYVIEQFDISENKTRVGLMTYSRYPFIRFALREDMNTSLVLNAVDNIPYIAGVTETHTALHLLQQEGFLGSRSNVAHVGVLLTTSTSLHRNETETIANNLNRHGVQMFVVGIGDRISKTELSTIATNPDDHHLILVHNFTTITDIQEKLTTLICDVPAHTYTPPTTTQPLLIQTARREPIKACKGKVADIVILLDSSRSLGEQHFTSVDHFALDIVNDLDIAENATMVGVISFSTYPVRRVKLGSMVDKLSILNSINQIQYYPGARETDKALQMLRIEGFDGERPGVPNMVILLTDGNSTNPFLTGRAADELKQSGVEVFVVGVGNKVSRTELDRISSGGNNHVFTVHNFLELDMSSFESNVAETVCGAIPTFTTSTKQTTTASTTASTSGPTTTTSSIKTTTVKTDSRCIPDVKDVMFLVDSSGSIGDDNFEHIKGFIKQTINTFDIGFNKTRVGLILFNSIAVILFPLDRYDSKQNILDAVNKVVYRPGGTNTSAALELLRTQGFTNDRPGAPNIAFLITDGYSTDKNATERQAILAKENNTIQIFATGIGQLLDFQELWTIASTNPITNKSLIYHVDDFDDLHVNSLEQILTNVICGADLATTTVSSTTISTSTVSTTVSTATQTTSAQCVDKVSNCDDYEEEMCTSYRPWAIAHCERHCGFCQGAPTTPAPCVDTVGNCREYGHDICTSSSFRRWTKEHCARFCEFCGVDILTAPKPESSTTETTTASSTSITTSTALVNETTEQNQTLGLLICSNKISNCADYGLDICSDYTPWATEHCKMFCGFCQGPSTTPKPCIDTIRNCHEFPPDICTSLSFVKWTKEHCAKFCKFCDVSSP